MSVEDQFQIVQRHVESLGEHFDTVQVFVTSHEGEQGTFTIQLGSGNWYARAGQVQEWLTKTNERTKQVVRHEEND